MNKKTSFQQQIFSEIQKRIGSNKMITIPETILKFCDDLETGVILSQLIYWCDKGKRPDGYIFKSYKEWNQETLLSEYKVRQATNKLKGKGILLIKTKRANGSPTIHYKLDRKVFRNSFFEFLQKERENFKNGNLKIEETLTDITTENTTDITTEKENINTYHQEEKNNSSCNSNSSTNSNNLSSPDGKEESNPVNQKDFDRFWNAYPKKVNEQQAIKEWNKLNPSPELIKTMLDFIKKAKDSEEWKQKDGLFITHPATFLRDKRWKDELTYVKDWREE